MQRQRPKCCGLNFKQRRPRQKAYLPFSSKSCPVYAQMQQTVLQMGCRPISMPSWRMVWRRSRCCPCMRMRICGCIRRTLKSHGACHRPALQYQDHLDQHVVVVWDLADDRVPGCGARPMDHGNTARGRGSAYLSAVSPPWYQGVDGTQSEDGCFCWATDWRTCAQCEWYWRMFTLSNLFQKPGEIPISIRLYLVVLVQHHHKGVWNGFIFF